MKELFIVNIRLFFFLVGRFSIKPVLFITVRVCVCARSLGTVNSPGMNCKVCQDIIKPLKHMITIRRVHSEENGTRE